MYTLNKEKKRLEPSETLCQYCETAHSTDMEDNYFVPLFKEADRTNIIVYRSVKFNKIPVGIPRCKTCKDIHEDAATKGGLIAWLGALIMVVLVFVIWGPWGILAIIAGIIGAAIGMGMIERKLVRDKQIYTKLDGALQNEAVQDLVLHGWSWTQPMA